MSQTILTARIYDQTVQLSNLALIASGSQGVLQIRCEFDSAWDGYGKTAVFYREKGKVYHMAVTEGLATIPHEVLAEEGYFYFGIFGTAENTRTTQVVRLNVEQGAITEATAETQEPTPDIYAQIMAAYGRMDGRLSEVIAMRGSGVTEFTVDGDCFRGTIYSNGAAAFISLEFYDLPLTANASRIDTCIPPAYAPLGLVVMKSLANSQDATITLSPRSWTNTEWAQIEITAGNEDITDAVEFEGYYNLESIFIAELADVRVDDAGVNHNTAGDAIRSQTENLGRRVSDLEENGAGEWVDIENLTAEVYNTATVGGVIGESIIPSSGAFKGQKIRVFAGDKFTITGKGGSSYRLWAFTDTAGVILSNAGSNVLKTDEVITAEVDGYLYTAIRYAEPHSLHQQKNPVQALAEANQRKIEEILKSNVLHGKKYIAAGDSYTAWSDATYADGVYGGQTVTYDREIRLRNGMTGENAGLSGSTMTYADGESIRSFSGSRYLEIPEDTDYLTIAFGINDAASRDLGQLGDTENTTFYGAWDKILKYYAGNRPEMKIGIICFARANNAFYNAVKAIAKHHGVPLLDFYGGEDTPMYVDGKAYEVDASLAAIKRDYWCGHAHSDGETEVFRGKTYKMTAGNANAGHPGYRAHIDEASTIEAFLRRL